MDISNISMDSNATTEVTYRDITQCLFKTRRLFQVHVLPPLYSLVFVIGLVGNILVVLVLLQHKRLRNMTNIYLLNLAFSDLLFLFTMPFWIHYYQKDNWVFSNVMCMLLSGLYYVGMFSEIFFIILLTIDRYLAIVHAVFAMRVRTVTFGIITSIVTWVLALLTSFPEFYLKFSVWYEGRNICAYFIRSESDKKWIQFQPLRLNILGLVLPLVIMTVCYTGIIKILLRRPNERKSKAVRLIFVIMIIYFLFWTPLNLTLFISLFEDTFLDINCEQSKQLYLAVQVALVISYMHCCVNPVIYVFVGVKFREYLRELFHNFLSLSLWQRLPFFHTENQERASSMSPSTGEQELSDGF